ncbi:NAD regulator [Brevundimonas sp. PAMC22021]|uniref:NUDIX hydrolase n=1 Tax=Brevundimonas sp. PAMC22021 TaxID=2861285 RepID=UPI001C62964F|nr:NAD regulator [Brevundimonas sp. PAMC22021]QYF87740.1 NAD regulator [Brevundimonas sp. PAMC22021]
MAPPTEAGVRIGLSAVVMALRERQAVVLTTAADEGVRALPFGPFDPLRDRTFERALRDFVTAQTGFRLGFVEQLYTFGDAGRGSPRAAQGPERQREVSVGYLALTPDAGSEQQTPQARWDRVLDFFPWEDRRDASASLSSVVIDRLLRWSESDPRRRARADNLFALSPGYRWNEERVLERYELLYEAGIVDEAARDADQPPIPHAPGLTMASDHRRILATALGRLRGKLKYRPVLFDLMPDAFTLSELQAAAEAVSGLSLHKQNFRRGVERTGLVAPTGRLSSATGGRPAELFRFRGVDPQDGSAPGLSLPAQR